MPTRRTLSGRQLERVLGHATFYSLLGQNTLRVFKAAYAFVSQVWSVKEEIRHFLGLMPLVSPRVGCLQEEVLCPRIGGD